MGKMLMFSIKDAMEKIMQLLFMRPIKAEDSLVLRFLNSRVKINLKKETEINTSTYLIKN